MHRSLVARYLLMPKKPVRYGDGRTRVRRYRLVRVEQDSSRTRAPFPARTAPVFGRG